MTTWFRAASVALPIALAAIAPRAQAPGDVRFASAMAVLTLQDGREVLAPLTTRTILRPKDRLKLFLRLATPGFAYVWLRSQAGTATLLYPSAVPTRGPESPDVDIFIPKGIDWFHAGTEPSTNTIHVVVSAEPLAELDAVFTSAREVTAAAASNALNRVRSRMGSLRSAAERPAEIGGRRRTTDYETRIADMAVESAGDRLVVKTFVLERR